MVQTSHSSTAAGVNRTRTLLACGVAAGPIYVVVGLLEAFTRLARVGMEHVVGYLEDGMTAWFREGLPVEQVPQVTVQDLHRELEHVQVIDVRQPGEWEQMHIAQALLKPLPKLTTMLEGIDRERPIAVHCKSGFLSSIATSLLKQNGFPQVMNVGQCGPNGGWYYDNPTTPTMINLCPASCQKAQSDPGSKIEIVLGCIKHVM